MADTIFSKIIRKEIPARIVHEDENYLAFHDVDPKAPTHILIIPKKPIATLNDVEPADAQIVGGMFLLAAKLMRSMGNSNFRTVFNCGEGAGQTVFHIHLHVLAGREFSWPPG